MPAELHAREAQELLQASLTLGILRRRRELREDEIKIGRRRATQSLLQMRHVHAERCHGIAEVVQDAAGVLGNAGIERQIDQPALCVGDALDHAVELAGKIPKFIAALQAHGHRARLRRARSPRHAPSPG